MPQNCRAQAHLFYVSVTVSAQTVDMSKTGHRPSEEQAARAKPQAAPSTLEHVLATMHLLAEDVRRRGVGGCWRGCEEPRLR